MAWAIFLLFDMFFTTKSWSIASSVALKQNVLLPAFTQNTGLIYFGLQCVMYSRY